MKAQTRIALVDCNNFYVSCERVFRPDLANKPVAVLSNNDGCIVARSPEVKALGVKMATPVYQVKDLISKHRIQLFSSNYPLYADMSARVMQLLEAFTPALEVYSIDESFLDLTGVADLNPEAYALDIKRTITRCTGIPVCVGMGPSKTLAKLANYAAKKWPKTGGVVDLADPVRRSRLMRITPVREVWGIGSRTAKRLNNMGIYSASDLARQNVDQIQRQFNIVVARTVLELNGTACQVLDEIPADKQQIVCSRSFTRRLTALDELSEALTEFVSRAVEKLRAQRSTAGMITVFIRTNPNNLNEPQYQRAINMRFEYATQNTCLMVSAAKQLLKQIFKPGYRYQKCGVQLSQISPFNQPGQVDLFEQLNSQDTDQGRVLMVTLDQINRSFPKSTKLAATGLKQRWQIPLKYLSQAYTTDWNNLATVQCK